jgi:hypothetical protein
MFGNRKRKPQEEESLVPHGLIWHATAEPTPEENAKNNEESLSHTVQFAQGIEQARKQQSPSEAVPGPQVVPPPAPVPASAPLPWWRVQQPEPEPPRPIVKPILLPLSAYAPPPPVQPSVEPPNIPPVQLPGIHPTLVRPPQVQPTHAQTTQIKPIRGQPTQAPQASAAQMVQRPVPQVPVTQIPAPVPVPHVQTPQIRKPEDEVRKPYVQNIPPAVPTERNSEALSRGIAQLRASGHGAWRAATSIGGRVRGGLLQGWQSVELRKAVLRAGQKGQDLLRRGVAGTRSYAQTSQSTILNLSRASLEHLKRMSARGNSVSVAGTKQISAVVTQRFSSQRIRSAVAGPVLRAKTLLAQLMSQWKTRRDRVAIDSRFWTSMTLAAISAIIVLGIVSVVPNYAAKSLPSRILSPNSSANANVAAPVALAAPRQTSPPQTSKTAVKKAPDPKPADQKPASPKAAAPPKAHRSADDDYVAPDTYKYYGNGSKRSR